MTMTRARSPSRDRRQTWSRTLVLLKAALPQLVLYDLVFKIVQLALLAPLGAWLLDRLIAQSGALAVTNADLADYLSGPTGIVFLVATLTLLLTSTFAEQSGLVRIAAAADAGRRMHWLDALQLTLADLPRLLHTALAQAALVVLGALPLAALAVLTYRSLLTAHDINWYLTERPPALWAALAIGGVIGAIGLGLLAWVIVRWSLALPATLNESVSGLSALRRSRDLVRAQWRRVARLTLGWIVVSVGVTAAVLLGLRLLAGLVLAPFTSIEAQVALTSVWLVIVTLTATLLGFVAFAGYSAILARLYEEAAGAPALPAAPVLASTNPRVTLRRAVVALSVMVGVATYAAVDTLNDLGIGRETAVTAHRGSSATAPENSLSAIRQAISDGADFAEIDVQETADGVLVLLHDSDLMRVVGLPRPIWEVTYDEIRDLDAGSWFSPDFADERIATLEQALDVARGRIGLNIELKFNGHDRQLAEGVARAVRTAGMAKRCVITSLSREGLASVRRIDPGLKIGQIVTVAIGDPRRLDVDLLSMEATRATPAAVRANRQAGLETHVWTVNERAQMQRMLERGVSNIITDRPAMLRELLDERSDHSDGELLLLALAGRLRG
jgi:glycerophosphoryl diester phosphodiesterase